MAVLQSPHVPAASSTPASTRLPYNTAITNSSFSSSDSTRRRAHHRALVSRQQMMPIPTGTHHMIRRLTPHARADLQDQPSVVTDEGIKWWERDLGVTLMDLNSMEELTDTVLAAEGKLVIVEFFASWCGSCRALYPKLCKLAKEHQDIVFAKVNFDENKALCKSLDIKVLPYFLFYRDEAKPLDSFSCSLAKLSKLKDAITRYNVTNRPTVDCDV